MRLAQKAKKKDANVAQLVAQLIRNQNNRFWGKNQPYNPITKGKSKEKPFKFDKLIIWDI